jgi:glutaryl-CoA dehydrogenase
VPEALRLPKAEGLKAPLSCLTPARFGIAWGVLGALEAVYTEAVEFAKSRSTFGEPIAKKQLVQAKLAEMLADHTEGLLLAWRLARLKDEGKLKPAQVSLAKRQNVWKALKAARLARDILGGSGITLEYHAIRHMLNLETVYTYEGTHDIHTLVLGREATGLSAF